MFNVSFGLLWLLRKESKEARREEGRDGRMEGGVKDGGWREGWRGLQTENKSKQM